MQGLNKLVIRDDDKDIFIVRESIQRQRIRGDLERFI